MTLSKNPFASLASYFRLLLALCILLLLGSERPVRGQDLLYEVSLNQRIDASTVIVEGRVGVQSYFWDKDRTNIYTASEIEVYKVFKGEMSVDQVAVITPGGFVGLEGTRVDPSLHLTPGETGLFFFDTAQAIHHGVAISSEHQFSPYASVQGFVRYDEFRGGAQDVFRTYQDVEAELYGPIAKRLGTSYRVVQAYTLPEPKTIPTPGKQTSMAPNITIFVPTSVTGGTRSVLTISGTSFGATQGTVFFSNGDDGGATFVPALATDVQSWSDTQITVWVPSGAGTGPIAVQDASTNVSFSATYLTVTYSLINAISGALGTGNRSYRTSHVNRNGSGGYTFRMHTDFANDTAANASFIRGLDSWRNTTGFNILIGANTSTDVVANDDINIVRFDNGGELPGGVLGRTTSRFSGCFINGNTDLEWYVEELDFAFDDNTSWNFGPASPGFTEYDFESVVLHEVGHSHQLAHVINTGAVMHYAIANGQESRTLGTGDLNAGSTMMTFSASRNPCGETGMTPNVLPVELVAFDALLEGATVVLTWETASETNNAGFQVETLDDIPGDGPDWKTDGFINGHGTTTEAQTYTYRLANTASGRHRFRLKQIDYDGAFEYSPEVEVFVAVPGSHHLSDGYPNPFNPTTTFTLILSRAQQVRLEVFDLLGRRVALLHDDRLAGEETHAFRFDAASLSSGTYLIRATGETFSTIRPITLVK